MGDFAAQYGPWAFVSGASAGIGEQFARQLAARGLNLVLAARRQERLTALGDELAAEHGIEYRAIAVDLGREDFLKQVREQTGDLEIGLLVNNAGFTNSGEFLDNPLDKELLLLHVNCRAAMMLAHHCGQAMRRRRRGGIIFLASVVGFAAVPYWAQYSASKAYDLQLAEALAGELEPHGVDVLAVCPGTTQTEFEEYSGMLASILAMQPDAVVRTGLRALGRRRVVIAGGLNRAQMFLTRLLPRSVNSWVAGRVVRDMVRH